MKICYSCFKKYEEHGSVCPFCGCVSDSVPIEPIHLTPGTILAGRFIIGYTVGSGGFGIVYKALDTKFNTIVAIKEFFISRICTRAGGLNNIIINKKSFTEFKYRKERFLAEARDMAKFGKHRSIPNVFEYFEENNTAYIVMELLNGLTLSDYLSQTKGRVDVDFALHVTNEIGVALKSLHEKKIIHRDVAPDNIFICTGKDIRIKLMDLGAAKLEDSTDDVIDIILKPGYSPPEQYDKVQNIGPWTDIYALGATLYLMLTGIKPSESTNRKIEDDLIPVNQLNPKVSENLNNAILKAMAIEPHMRFKTVEEFLKAINGEKKVVSLKKEKKKRKRKRLSGIIAVMLTIAIGAGFTVRYFNDKKSTVKLEEATITIWIPLLDESTKYAEKINNNQKNIWQQITDSFCQNSDNNNVTIKINYCSQTTYEEDLENALNFNDEDAPSIFYSSDILENIVETYAYKLDFLQENDDLKGCKFLNDNYDIVYPDKLKVPLSINCQVAFLQSKEESDDINDIVSFSDISELSLYGQVYRDSNCNLFSEDYEMSDIDFTSYSEFNDDVASFLTGTDSYSMFYYLKNESDRNLKIVFPSEDIYCKFSNEFSINNNISEAQMKAAQKFLESLLNNAEYQKGLNLRNRVPVYESVIDESNFFINGEDIYSRLKLGE